MNIGIAKDIDKQYLYAVEYYEKELNANERPDVDLFANLAFLYWSFAFEKFAFVIPNSIPEDMSIVGGERFELILNKGLSIHPDSLELNFWKHYLLFIAYSKDFSESDCKQLILDYPDDNLVVYFFLNSFNKGAYSQEINKLLGICKQFPTAKNNYIRSIIE